MNNEKCLRPNEHLLYGDITNFLSYHKAILVANLVNLVPVMLLKQGLSYKKIVKDFSS